MLDTAHQSLKTLQLACPSLLVVLVPFACTRHLGILMMALVFGLVNVMCDKSSKNCDASRVRAWKGRPNNISYAASSTTYTCRLKSYPPSVIFRSRSSPIEVLYKLFANSILTDSASASAKLPRFSPSTAQSGHIRADIEETETEWASSSKAAVLPPLLLL